jgi:S-sulfosulfanyl-L-cysteine sulfohydrolase
MRLVNFFLVASILMASGIGAEAVEMVRPIEALEQSRRDRIKVDNRLKHEEADRRKREKELEAKRQGEAAEQRKRESQEFEFLTAYKAQQEAQRKREETAAKAAQGARPSSTDIPPQPTAGQSGPTAPSQGHLTLIHMGDIHGHLVPRPSVERGDATGRTEGGLARMYSKIRQIRDRQGPARTLLFNTGDTLQGSAEALFTRGQALVDVLNRFGIDAYSPGNWDWVYGVPRFLELFAGPNPKAPWHALTANAYFEGEPYADRAGERVVPPYLIRVVDGVRVGILGFTSDRGPQVVGTGVTKGVRFTKGDAEVAALVRTLREQERVDLVVMISELGLANNLRLAEQTPGIDVILSSDMHEITREPVRTATGTLIVEAGMDGQVLGEFNLKVENGRVASWHWTLHRIDERTPEDVGIVAAIAAIRAPFVSGRAFREQVNPFNGARLTRPIDTVVGQTSVALHRTNFSSQPFAAVIEGTSHSMLTDAFRAETGAQIGAIRGFRYGTVVPPGPIRLEDLYHFMPIGPMIAKGTIKGRQLKNQIEAAADGSLNPDVSKWTGGWLFNFSGAMMDLDPFAKTGERARAIQIYDEATSAWHPLDLDADYTYASYYYMMDPGLINVLPARDIQVLREPDGRPLDGTEVVARYLQTRSGGVGPERGRIRMLRPLPSAGFGSLFIQPLRGVAAAPASEEGRSISGTSTPDTGGTTAAGTQN